MELYPETLDFEHFAINFDLRDVLDKSSWVWHGPILHSVTRNYKQLQKSGYFPGMLSSKTLS